MICQQSYTAPHLAQAGLRGLSATSATSASMQKMVISAPQIAGSVLTSIASTGGIWGMSAALAVPVIGAVVVGVTMVIMLIMSRKGPKQKVATTEIVNKIEPLLAENRDGYLSGPRTVSSQAQALENFKAGWQYILDNCGAPVMGTPGKNCISERSPGGQWDWWAYYYDPIAEDTEVKKDPVLDGNGNLIDSVTGQIFGGGSFSGSAPLLLAGLALAAAFAMGGKD